MRRLPYHKLWNLWTYAEDRRSIRYHSKRFGQERSFRNTRNFEFGFEIQYF